MCCALQINFSQVKPSKANIDTLTHLIVVKTILNLLEVLFSRLIPFERVISRLPGIKPIDPFPHMC